MPAPSANWTMVTLRWNFVNLDGSKPAGSVKITPYTSRFRVTGVSSDTLVLNGPITAPLVNGAVTVSVPATDDPDTDPTGFTYEITEIITGVKPNVSYHIEVPSSMSATGIDVAEVAPVSSSVGLPVSLVTRSEFDALSDAVDDLESSGGGAVDSVNGSTGVVVLDADDIADTASKKIMTSAERTKLTSVATGATANSSDATLLARANHTGTQSSSTISDFTEAAQDAIAALLASGTGITLSYNDVANTLTVTNSGGGGGLDAEAVRDAIGVAMVGAGLISITVNDGADTITVSTTATANDTDANLKARANHTGVQAISTVTGLQTALDGKIDETSAGYIGFAALHPGGVITVRKDPSTGFWPTSYNSDGTPSYTSGTSSTGVRPTSRADIFVHWKGAAPFPPVVTSGAAGVRDNLDIMFEEIP